MQKKVNRKRQPPPSEITIYLPGDARPQDKFEAVIIPDNSLSDIGVKRKDVAIVFLTSDIKSGDLVLLDMPRGHLTGKFHLAPDGIIHIDPLNDEYEPEVYSPGEAKIAGRITHFERNGQEVSLGIELRPLRPTQQAKTKRQPADNRSAEITRLESKLTRLQETGDITDTTQCFQLEKKIYDLKRDIERDEWPDVIGGEDEQ